MHTTVIPYPLHIVIDDMGWFCGKDDRLQGGPSRTGATRNHCCEDYLAINELGRRLNMKICCAFVLGEWDPDDRLRSVKNLSKYGDEWNNAAHLNHAEALRCAHAVNRAQYIDIAVHGLMHGYYIPDTDDTDGSDFYYKTNGRLFMVDESEIRHRLNCYFDLLKYYGINKPINTFVPPAFFYRWDELAPILKEYGIEFVSTVFRTMEHPGEKPTLIGVESCGLINADRNNNLIEWDVMNCDLSQTPTDVHGIFGMHWPNFLHEDPARNMETVERAVAYFERCKENFGTVLSQNIRSFATQMLFAQNTRLTEQENRLQIDISSVPCLPQTENSFCINALQPPTRAEGCHIQIAEQHRSFTTYRLTPYATSITLEW